MADYFTKDKELKHQGLLAGEGFWVLERMDRLEIQRICTSESSLERVKSLEHVKKFPGEIEVMDSESLSRTAGYSFHRGVYTIARRPKVSRLVDIQGEIILGCIDIRDQGNLGSLIRSAAAFGCSGIMVTPGCADLYSRKVIRTSMAHVLKLPIYLVSGPEDLKGVKKRGYSVVATGVGPKFSPIDSGTKKRMEGAPRVILIGSEGEGLSTDWATASDAAVTIPMDGGIDSLNAGVAGGIVLYELLQRRD